jgi:hypothetical protein
MASDPEFSKLLLKWFEKSPFRFKVKAEKAIQTGEYIEYFKY